MEPIVDLLNNGNASGETAAHLLANGITDVGMLKPWIGRDGKIYATVYKGAGDPKKAENYKDIQVNNLTGTLRPDEWKALDEAVIGVAEGRLGGIQDLISRGLTYDLGNGFGTTVLEGHTISDAHKAELSMDGLTRSRNDRQVFKNFYLPIPIIHVDYEINARVLAASRNMGNALDTTNAERAARKVAEKLESLLFIDTPYSYGGGTIYGYINYPDRVKVSLGTAWDDVSVKGEDIVKKVLEMKQKSINSFHYGPWVLYIPTDYETKMDEDYDVSGASMQTTRERILKISGINEVKVIDTLPANNVLLVQMTRDVVRLVRGMGIQNVQWKSEGNMVTNYKVMTIQVPQIRSSSNGKTGIIHAS